MPVTVHALTPIGQTWTGWVDTVGTFSAVSATWVVPPVTCTPGQIAETAQWVGVGGSGSPTVAQDGTETVCGGPHVDTENYAWYEIYGDGALNSGYQVYINQAPVAPGDVMFGSVTYAQDVWTFVVTDETAGWTTTNPVTWIPTANAQSSAEFIVERNGGCPTPATCWPNAAFASVPFTNASVTSNGVTGTISSFSPVAFTGSINGATDATTGPLNAAGTAFTVFGTLASP